MHTNNDEHFRGLWFRAKSEPSLATLTPELVKCWARAKGLDVQQVEERDVGAFSPIPCIVLTLPNAKACFPKVRSEGEQGWVNRRRFADSEAVHWRKMDWFVPLWWMKQLRFQSGTKKRPKDATNQSNWFQQITPAKPLDRRLKTGLALNLRTQTKGIFNEIDNEQSMYIETVTTNQVTDILDSRDIETGWLEHTASIYASHPDTPESLTLVAKLEYETINIDTLTDLALIKGMSSDQLVHRRGLTAETSDALVLLQDEAKKQKLCLSLGMKDIIIHGKWWVS